MLIGLAIRDVVLIESLDLSIGAGFTALTGETGAGKSILLDALGLATGTRAEAGLVRRGAAAAQATALFALPADHAAWAYLDDKGLACVRDEDLVLRRTLTSDGRSRAFVNDQPTSVAVLRDLSAMLLEVHGQHETVGLLDAGTHRALLDGFGRTGTELAEVGRTWSAWRAAREAADALKDRASRAAADTEEMSLRLAELDRLDPREGEEASLAEERALLGAAEKALTDISAAREALDGTNLTGRLAQAQRSLERARDLTVQAGASEQGRATVLIGDAAAAAARALTEAVEAVAAVDAAAAAFDFEPDRLERAEERLFALRAMARKLSVTVDDLPTERARFAIELQGADDIDAAIAEAEKAASAARGSYIEAAARLSVARRAAGDRLSAAMAQELPPLRLDKAQFRVGLEPVAEDRLGPAGADKVAFEVSTNPGAPFGPLGQIASGGELARFALALKASLAGRDAGQPLMIFDEVDQGVGGAVADAVGVRLRRLAAGAQVLAVTHSPQVAARAATHWRVSKVGEGAALRTQVEQLSAAEREEENARMLAGAEITAEARAAARALIGG